MTSTLSFLLCLGLCLNQRISAQEGLLPKPNLLVQKDFILVPKGSIIFRCNISDDDLPPQKWTYLLFKEGNSKPLYEKTTEASWVEFTLPFETTQDFGNYSCKYFGSQNPQIKSEASTVLEISEKARPSNSQRDSELDPYLKSLRTPVTLTKGHLPASTQPVLGCGTEQIPCSKFDELDENVTISIKNHSHHQMLNHHSLPLFIGLLLSSTLLYWYRHGQEETDPSNSGAEDQQGVTYIHLNIEILNSTQSVYFVINLFSISLVGLVLLVMGKLLASEWKGLRS